MAWSRVYAAALRHLLAWWGGEDEDPETELSHLAHAACCVVFLVAYQGRGVGVDDRPHRPIKALMDEVSAQQVSHA